MSLKYRPMAVCGFTMLGSLLVIILCGYSDIAATIALILGLLCIASAFCFKTLRASVVPFMLAAGFILSGLLFTAQNNYGYEMSRIAKGDEVNIVAEICEEPEYNNSDYYYSLKTKTVNNKKAEMKMLVTSGSPLPAAVSDVISAKAKIYSIKKNDDSSVRYISKGIFVSGYFTQSEVKIVSSDVHNINYSLYKIRSYIKNGIYKFNPTQNGALIVAMLLGDKSLLSDELLNAFKCNGVTHLFAVSGIHLSVWAMGMFEVLKRLKLKKRTAGAATIIFTVFFMALTGFSPSVSRAGIMLTVMLLGNMTYRRPDSLNSMGLAIIVILCVQPFAAIDIGFLLSFASTFGIVVIFPSLSKATYTVYNKIKCSIIRKLVKVLSDTFFISICATLMTLPIIAFSFGYFSVAAPVANVFVTYAATITMVLGGFSAILSFFPPVANLFGFSAGILAKYIIFIALKISKLPLTLVSVSSGISKGGIIIAAAGVVAIAVLLKGCAHLKRYIASFLIVCIIIATFANYAYNDELTSITVFNVENGLSAVASKGNKKIVIGCSGTAWNTSSKISAGLNASSFCDGDVIIIPSLTNTSASVSTAVMSSCRFNYAVMPQKLSFYSDYCKNVVAASSVSKQVWEGGSISCCFSDEYSYVYADFNGTTILFLFSACKYADIDKKVLNADLLITAVYSENIVKNSVFKKVIISADKNRSLEMRSSFKKQNYNAVATANSGDIIAEIKKSGNYKIYCEN